MQQFRYRTSNFVTLQHVEISVLRDCSWTKKHKKVGDCIESEAWIVYIRPLHELRGGSKCIGQKWHTRNPRVVSESLRPP